MTKIIIFDFDGTLADTIPISINILKNLASKYYHKTIDEKLIKKLRNKSIPEIFKELDISIIKLPFIARKARKELNKEIANLKPIKGISEILNQLKKQKIILGIVSSNSKESIIKFLEVNNLNIFNFIYTNSRIFGKANNLKRLLRRNKWNIENTIYIGDEIRDIEAAKKTGIKIISVAWGVNSLKKLAQYHPDILVKSPQELLTRLQSIIK
ncbi:HAD-IA family hydrolase [Patescibacteria group bacterium]|nr:HAD-IA family hydrolase [Patescibacteria group bacterium]MBU4015952.1 HAD-IA family hydrolase [Patescibacteria group bacterium]MBU4099652.1 HAD-IA family hydrolase [Patescibacteria group bacterium]